MSSRLDPCPPQLAVELLAPCLDGQERPRVIDLGCGDGSTLAALAAARPGWKLAGIEPEPELAAQARRACPQASIIQAKGEELPLTDSCCDALIAECVFSLLDPGAEAELARVVKARGLLLLTDLYSRDEQDYELAGGGLLRYIRSRHTTEGLLARAGFSLLSFSDYSSALAGLLGQLILDGTICACLSPDTLAQLRKVKPGYGVWLLRRDSHD